MNTIEDVKSMVAECGFNPKHYKPKNPRQQDGIKFKYDYRKRGHCIVVNALQDKLIETGQWFCTDVDFEVFIIPIQPA